MAILLDDRVQGQPPVIQGRIDRRGQITLGNKTMQEAQDLALTLKAGALPVPLKIVDEPRGRSEPRRRLDPQGHPRRAGRHRRS